MEVVTVDEYHLERIGALISSTLSLPHGKYAYRARRFCYIIPTNDPSILIHASAFPTDVESMVPNLKDLKPVPLTGDVYTVDGKDVPVCVFIAYSKFNASKQLVSTHCEKVLLPVPYLAALHEGEILRLKGGNLLQGLHVPDNVISLAQYRARA